MNTLVINLGLKSIRGIIFTESGKEVFNKAYPVHTTLVSERVEQNAHEWNELFDNILNEIAIFSKLSENIRYVTVTTSSSCILGLGEGGEILTPVMMVSDKRSELQVEAIKAAASFGNFEALEVSAQTTIPKALWWQKNHPQTFAKVKHWVNASDYLVYLMTGEVVTDSLNASKSLYLEGQGKYCDDVLNELNFDISTLPKVQSIGDRLALKKSFKQKYELSSNCEFVFSTYDAICAVIGSTNGRDNNAIDVSGTVTSVRTIIPNNKSVQKGIRKQPVPLLDSYFIGYSNNLGGGLLEWLKQSFYSEGKDPYNRMENDAKNSGVGANGITFLPYLLGERYPVNNPNAKGIFFGIDRKNSQPDFSRAVLESMAFITKDLVLAIEDCGVGIDRVTVSGGLARLNLVNEIKADVTGKEVAVVENYESTAIGSFILVALSVGIFNDYEEAIEKSIRVKMIIYPTPENHQYYQDAFGLYKQLYQDSINLFEKHNEISQKFEKFSIERISNL